MGADAKRKEARKRKFSEQAADSIAIAAPTIVDREAIVAEPPKKKKRRGSSIVRRSGSPAGKHSEEIGSPTTINVRGQDQDTAESKAPRFIVFIGNLPYTATDQSLSKHFAKIPPKSIRHRTEKGSGKSKGFAFLEFQDYDRMKTCLKMYHGSSFDDGISPARKLNVELTAGGCGGKSKERKGKLRAKNEKLNEQRLRRAQEEAKQHGNIKSKKLHKQGEGPNQEQEKQISGNNGESRQGSPFNNGDIHPSRRSRMAVPIQANDT